MITETAPGEFQHLELWSEAPSEFLQTLCDSRTPLRYLNCKLIV